MPKFIDMNAPIRVTKIVAFITTPVSRLLRLSGSCAFFFKGRIDHLQINKVRVIEDDTSWKGKNRSRFSSA